MLYLWQNLQVMRYIIRAIKYYIYICILCTILVLCIGFIKNTGFNPELLFKDGYYSILYCLGFLALISCFYPMLGYCKQNIVCRKDFESAKGDICSVILNKGYVLSDDKGDRLVFKSTNLYKSITKLGEDKIYVSKISGGIEIDGIRTDVVRLKISLYPVLNPSSES